MNCSFISYANEQQALVRKYKSLIALKTVKHGLGLSVLE